GACFGISDCGGHATVRPLYLRLGASVMLRPDESFDHMIYVRLIEACNLHCAHCFIPNNPKRMSWAEIEAMPAKIREFAKPGQRLLFQFHGGEPTLYGVEELRKVCVYLL